MALSAGGVGGEHVVHLPEELLDALVLAQVLAALHKERVLARVVAPDHHLLRLSDRRHHTHLQTGSPCVCVWGGGGVRVCAHVCVMVGKALFPITNRPVFRVTSSEAALMWSVADKNPSEIHTHTHKHTHTHTHTFKFRDVGPRRPPSRHHLNSGRADHKTDVDWSSFSKSN